MAQATETDPRVPLSWIVLFFLLVFGLGAFAILSVGGELVSTAGFLLA
jgi:hypothetical protein